MVFKEVKNMLMEVKEKTQISQDTPQTSLSQHAAFGTNLLGSRDIASKQTKNQTTEFGALQ